eukprot:TRINITY_DN8305_c0_g1_i2.p1 TRINITY_DN8305_c0_g1~~TRINITY_DN8305_c0_g1_i2.p1  ORF type:complete len:258 (-),score=41.17 TRINITY_DN8305_c0_g1_i2:220-993(-)
MKMMATHFCHTEVYTCCLCTLCQVNCLCLNALEKRRFYTVEARAEGTGERLGLDVVTLAGERAPLCRLRRGCGPKIGKYYVAIEEFERIVLPHLTPNSKVKLHVIDEVGRMELCSEKFKAALLLLLSSPQAVFGSLPAPRFGHTLSLVEEIKQRPDTAILTLTKANRDGTACHVEELLMKLLEEDQGSSDEAAVAAEGGSFIPPFYTGHNQNNRNSNSSNNSSGSNGQLHQHDPEDSCKGESILGKRMRETHHENFD